MWSKVDYTNLAKEIHESMLAEGFIRQSYFDLYEKDTKVHHKVMRFLKEIKKMGQYGLKDSNNPLFINRQA